MFYIYLILKIFSFFFLPIYSLRLKQTMRILNLCTFIQLVWVLYIAFLTYIPFFYYYQQNEVNIQHLIPNYIFLVLISLYFVLPIIYFTLLRLIFNKFRSILKILGVIFMIISSIIIFGIEFYNHSKRIELEKICYIYHNSTDDKLTCCLQAEYIWNEGFSFLNAIPNECKQYINWND